MTSPSFLGSIRCLGVDDLPDEVELASGISRYRKTVIIGGSPSSAWRQPQDLSYRDII